MKRFFLPTDFTDLANNTMLEAAQFASKFGAELIVAHTYHRPTNAKGPGVLQAFEKSLNKKFNALVEQNQILQEVKTSFVAKLGFVKEEIPKMRVNTPRRATIKREILKLIGFMLPFPQVFFRSLGKVWLGQRAYGCNRQRRSSNLLEYRTLVTLR